MQGAIQFAAAAGAADDCENGDNMNQTKQQQQQAGDEYSSCDLRTRIQLLQSKLHPSSVDGGKWKFKQEDEGAADESKRQFSTSDLNKQVMNMKKTNAKSISDTSSSCQQRQQQQQQQKRHEHQQASSQNSLDSTSRQSPLDDSLGSDILSNTPVGDVGSADSLSIHSTCSSASTSSSSSSSMAPTPPPRFSSLQASRQSETPAPATTTTTSGRPQHSVAHEVNQHLQWQRQVNTPPPPTPPGREEDGCFFNNHQISQQTQALRQQQHHQQNAGQVTRSGSNQGANSSNIQTPLLPPFGPHHANQFTAPPAAAAAMAQYQAQVTSKTSIKNSDGAGNNNDSGNYASKQTCSNNNPAATGQQASRLLPQQQHLQQQRPDTTSAVFSPPATFAATKMTTTTTTTATTMMMMMPPTSTCSRPHQIDPEFRIAGDAPITKALQLQLQQQQKQQQQQQQQQQQATFVINRPSSRHPIRGCLLPPTPIQLQQQRQAGAHLNQLGSISSASMSSISSTTSSSSTTTFSNSHLGQHLKTPPVQGRLGNMAASKSPNGIQSMPQISASRQHTNGDDNLLEQQQQRRLRRRRQRQQRRPRHLTNSQGFSKDRYEADEEEGREDEFEVEETESCKARCYLRHLRHKLRFGGSAKLVGERLESCVDDSGRHSLLINCGELKVELNGNEAANEDECYHDFDSDSCTDEQNAECPLLPLHNEETMMRGWPEHLAATLETGGDESGNARENELDELEEEEELTSLWPMVALHENPLNYCDYSEIDPLLVGAGEGHEEVGGHEVGQVLLERSRLLSLREEHCSRNRAAVRLISPDSVQLLVSDPRQQPAGQQDTTTTPMMQHESAQVHQFSANSSKQREAERRQHSARPANNDTSAAEDNADADNNEPGNCDAPKSSRDSAAAEANGIDRRPLTGGRQVEPAMSQQQQQRLATRLLAVNSRLQAPLPTLQQLQQQLQQQQQNRRSPVQQQRQQQLSGGPTIASDNSAEDDDVAGRNHGNCAGQQQQQQAAQAQTPALTPTPTPTDARKSSAANEQQQQQQELAQPPHQQPATGCPASARPASSDAAAGRATTAVEMEIEQTTALPSRSSTNTFHIAAVAAGQQVNLMANKLQQQQQLQQRNQFTNHLNNKPPITQVAHHSIGLINNNNNNQPNDDFNARQRQHQAATSNRPHQQTLLTTADNIRLHHQQQQQQQRHHQYNSRPNWQQQTQMRQYQQQQQHYLQQQDPIPAPRVSGATPNNNNNSPMQHTNNNRSPPARDLQDELSIFTGALSSSSSPSMSSSWNNPKLKNLSTLAGSILSPATGLSTPLSDASSSRLMSDAAASELIPKLIARLDRKLVVLKEEQLTLMREIQLNEATGQRLFESMKRHLTVSEFEKITLHADEIEKVTKLILSLRSRLKRFEAELKERAALGSRAPRGQPQQQQQIAPPNATATGNNNNRENGINSNASQTKKQQQQQTDDSLRLLQAPTTIRGISDPTSTTGLPKRQHQHHASLQANQLPGMEAPGGVVKLAATELQASSSSSARNSATINCDAIDQGETKTVAANSSSSDSIFNSADSAIGSTINGHGGSVSNMEQQQQPSKQQHAALSQSSLASTSSGASSASIRNHHQHHPHLSSSISVSSHNSINSSVPNSPVLVSPTTTAVGPARCSPGVRPPLPPLAQNGQQIGERQVASVQPFQEQKQQDEQKASNVSSDNHNSSVSSDRGAPNNISHNETNDSIMLALTDFDILIAKRNKLVSQMEEAHQLEECILRRNDIIVEKILKKYFDENKEPNEISEFKQFTKLKSLLLKDTHDVADRIDNAEHQLIELRQTNQHCIS